VLGMVHSLSHRSAVCKQSPTCIGSKKVKSTNNDFKTSGSMHTRVVLLRPNIEETVMCTSKSTLRADHPT
jgi:hypothetical protein